MGMNKVDVHDSLLKRRTNGRFDDFNDYSSGGYWTSTLNGSATAAVGNGLGGVLVMSAVDSTANRELYVANTNSIFLLQANSPIYVETGIQYAEANVNQAMVMFGVMNAVGNGSIVNTTGAPKSSFSGAVIYKVPGSTVWQTCSSVGSTQNLSVSTATAGGSAYHRLGIQINPVSSTIAEVSYFLDDVQLLTSTGRPGQNLIQDQLTYTGAVAMQMFVGLKNGSTSPEQLNIDYAAHEFQCRQFSPST